MKPEQSLSDLHALRNQLVKHISKLPSAAGPAGTLGPHSEPELQAGKGWRRIVFLDAWPEVAAQLQAFAPGSGWLAWQFAGLRAFANPEVDSAAAPFSCCAEQIGDVVLQAELASACGQHSLHLQMQGAERWRLAYFFSQTPLASNTPAEPSDTARLEDAENLDALLFSEIRHVGKHGVTWLNYQIWWQFQAHGQWQQIAARLQNLEMQKARDGVPHAK